MISTRLKGIFYEKIAQNYVKSLGYKILETNFSNKIGEIDIIAQDKDYLVFIEVKSRASEKFGRPSEAVNYAKQTKIRRVAESYLIKKHLNNQFCRFDVLEILENDINYIINAF